MSVPLKIDLLGPAQVWVDGLPLPKLRSRKALWLLAYLTLHEGGPISRERLAFALWPDAESSVGLSSLRSVVSELRQALGGQRERLAGPDRNTLRLDLRDAEVDVSEFDRAIRDRRFERAVEVYRSELLEGCSEEWVDQERRVRQECCLSALLSLGDVAAKTKDHERAILLYRRATVLDPWRDAAQRGLMAALAESGEINGALQTYREFAHRLSRDAGMAPDERTTEMYLSLRSKDKRPKKEYARTEASRSKTDVGHLPRSLSPLVGREDERADVVAKLRLNRLVTLTGVGGVGKTRLAIEAAEEARPTFSDGAWFVPLEALRQDSQVAPAIAAALGIPEEPDVPTLDILVKALRGQRALIVLDNCEHLLDGAATVCEGILRECGEVRILATSREALELPGEGVWPVPGLSVPDPAHLPTNGSTRTRVALSYEGVALFVERAQSVAPDFTLGADNAATVAEICSRLEGIPLAIELTAVQLGAMSVAGVAERLDDLLKPLAVGRRTGSPRQQTMRSALDWSYGLLSVGERIALAGLSVFSGGWTLESAEEVIGVESNERETPALLRSLVGKSLVVYSIEVDRYRMLEPVRQYAAAKLEESGAAADYRARHQRRFVRLSETAEGFLIGANQPLWIHRLALEMDNLERAIDWVEPPSEEDASLRIVSAIWRYWFVKGEFERGFQKLRLALDRSDEPTLARGKALLGAGVMRSSQTRTEEARELFLQGLSIAEALGESLVIATLLSRLATATKDPPTKQAFQMRALGMYRELDDSFGVAAMLGNLSVAASARGEYVSARTMRMEGLAYAVKTGDPHLLAWTHQSLGNVEGALGDYSAARANHQESLRYHEEVDSKRGIAMSLHDLGIISHLTGDSVGARAHFERAIELFKEVGDKQGEAELLCEFAKLDDERGDWTSAQSLIEQSLLLLRHLDDSIRTAGSLKVKARIRRRAHQVDAGAIMCDCFRLLLTCNYMPYVIEALEEMGAILLTKEDPRHAAYLWGAASALRESCGTPVPPNSGDSLAEWRSQAAALLGEEEYAGATREGTAADWREAITTLLRRS